MHYNQSMRQHCSLRAGGTVENLFIPNSIDELLAFLRGNQRPILMLGLGSNLLVRDGGFLGTAIKLTTFNQLEFKDGVVDVEAGVTLAKLSRFCEAQGLNGAEFLSAIPGTVGGALAMNAGAFGADIWTMVESVTTVDDLGAVFRRNKSEFEIGYRKVTPHHQGEVFIGASLRFSQVEKQDNIKDLLKKRNDAQPIGAPSCGSVFKNPPDYYAAQLIEDSGLKGFCVGGACVSNKHANFIINADNASTDEIENLILHIQKTVQSDAGVALETEVVIV
jgi:UDP-N-acetylmuramate dehydrogenase